ncbi:MAG: hypothetical protein IKR78_05600 [Dehalococcoidales bacterium]|nr:hypothetical protein [Dehalococcoidales bacterium]
MKRFAYIALAVIMIIGTVITAGCLNTETKTTDDIHLVFERIVSGDDIPKYIPFGYEGLIAEYEYVDHVYHQGDSFTDHSIFRTTYIYDSPESAAKRYTSLKRTYKDDVVQVGNIIYLNEIRQNAVITSSIHWQKNYNEMLEYMLDSDFLLISPENP